MTIEEYWREVDKVYAYYLPAGVNRWRYGQTASNVLHNHYPDAANLVRHTEADPFNVPDTEIHRSSRWNNFVSYVEGYFAGLKE